MFDLILRGGEVVDGTGAQRYRADVGIRNGYIAGIGNLEEGGRQITDVTGAIIAPGFIDIHTHYDAQAFFDPTLGPSPLHGVTTVVGGNCGFSIAPLSLESTDYLMKTLARVEGMPLDSLVEAVPWDWASMADYLGRLEGRLAINAGFMVGHTAVRRVVMGEAALERQATEDELWAMAAVVHESLSAGALGLSSSWAQAHSDADGRPVPSRVANERELLELFAVCADHKGTSVEFNLRNGGPRNEDDYRLLAAISIAAQRPVNWNAVRPTAANELDCLETLKAGTYATERGGRVVGLVFPFHMPLRFNFQSCFGLDLLPGWDKLTQLPIAERLHYLQDSAQRSRLAELAAQPSPVSWVARWSSHALYETYSPENEPFRGRVVGDIAAEEGRDPFDVLLDLVCRDGLRTSFGTPAPMESREDWEARARICRDPRTVIGASDAGAHLDMSGSFNYTTLLLSKFVREQHLMSVEEAVYHLTAVPADFYGLRDRGRLSLGSIADVVVFDEETVGSSLPTLRYDLPAGAGRFYAESTGIRHVFVHGEEVVAAGRFTDVRPGQIIRSGLDTFTPSLDHPSTDS